MNNSHIEKTVLLYLQMLQIPFKQEEQSLHINFPKTLSHLQGEYGILSSQEKHMQSFLQAVAPIVSQYVKGTLFGTVEQSYWQSHFPEQTAERYLFVWFKISVFGVTLDHYIKGIGFDFETNKSFYIENDILSHIPAITEKKQIQTFWKENLTDSVLENTKQIVHTHALRLLQNKQFFQQEQLDTEIKRIHDYYQLLQKENSTAESIFVADEELAYHRHLLEQEKELLLLQQNEKYKLNEESIHIEPIFCIALQIKKTVS